MSTSAPSSKDKPYRISKQPQFAKKPKKEEEEEEEPQEPTSPTVMPVPKSPPKGDEEMGEEQGEELGEERVEGGSEGKGENDVSDVEVPADAPAPDEGTGAGPGGDADDVSEIDEGVPVNSIVRARSPDTVTDPLDINEDYFITHGKFTYGVNSDDILLKGTPMELPDGPTLGNVRVSRSYEQWGPYMRPNNLWVLEHEGISYLYVIMCVAGSDAKKHSVDSRRLRHVPSVVAIKIVQELKKKADNWPDWKVEKYKPVLQYEETENQQIEPKAAKWQTYKKVKNVPSAEESHEPVPRKKKKFSNCARGRAADTDEVLEDGEDGEPPTVVMRGANKVKRFKIGVGEKAHLLHLGRYVYVVVEDAPVDDDNDDN